LRLVKLLHTRTRRLKGVVSISRITMMRAACELTVGGTMMRVALTLGVGNKADSEGVVDSLYPAACFRCSPRRCCALGSGPTTVLGTSAIAIRVAKDPGERRDRVARGARGVRLVGLACKACHI